MSDSLNLCEITQVFFNLRFNLRKIEGGEGVITKPEGLLEENKGGEGGGLELFSRSANKKNLR